MQRDGLVDPRLGKRIIAETRLRRQELRVERAIKRALALHKKMAIERLKAQHLTAAAPPDPFGTDTWDSTVDDEIEPDIATVLATIAEGTFNFLRLPKDAQNRILNEIDLSGRTASFTAKVRTVGQDVATRLIDELGVGVAKGESIDELTDRIDKVFATGDKIAERIARTETHGAAEATTYDSAGAIADAGFTVTKEWVATEDDRTRPTHADADGQVVDINDTYSVGDDELMYPGDESGSAEETINCRCSQTFDMPDGQSQNESGSGALLDGETDNSGAADE